MTAPEGPIARARRCALWYRSLGYQPLPSRDDVKGPALAGYADYWDEPLPESTYAAGDWRAGSVQLMTGVRWGLIAVDCDGTEAMAVWESLCRDHKHAPATWTVRTGGGGTHFYYATPAGLDACPSRRIWSLWDPYGGVKHEGDWSKHREVRLLGDHALVIAPPSVHVVTGRPYEFLPGRSPRDLARPLEAPRWLLRMPPLAVPTYRLPAPPPLRPRPDAVPPPPRAGPLPDRDAVLDAIGPGKHLLARRHGLRLASARAGPNAGGWVSCHAHDRDDDAPSASIHHESGVYYDFRGAHILPFFDLLAALDPHAFLDWEDALRALGREYGIGKNPPHARISSAT